MTTLGCRTGFPFSAVCRKVPCFYAHAAILTPHLETDHEKVCIRSCSIVPSGRSFNRIGGGEVQYTWKYEGDRTDRDSDRVFAWQVGAGVGYRAAGLQITSPLISVTVTSPHRMWKRAGREHLPMCFEQDHARSTIRLLSGFDLNPHSETRYQATVSVFSAQSPFFPRLTFLKTCRHSPLFAEKISTFTVIRTVPPPCSAVCEPVQRFRNDGSHALFELSRYATNSFFVVFICQQYLTYK